MDENLRAAIATALELHEIGHGDPYRLSFAGKGNSGPSFGKMQGDLNTQPLARDTLKNVLLTNGVDPQRTAALISQLSHPMVANPLTTADDQLVESALASASGQQLVDQMDQSILGEVLGEVDDCLDTAQTARRQVEPKAAIYMALWINMSGPPTTLKSWLAGHDVWLDHHANHVAAPGDVVTADDVADYLKATDYYVANPGNFAHLQLAAAAGVSQLA